MADLIKYAEPYFNGDELAAAVNSLMKGWLGLSSAGEELEAELAPWFGKKTGVLVNSGSSANLLATTALGLAKGDSVITTACCFPTTVNPIIQNGLVPIFVDVDLGAYTIKIDELENAIRPNTKAVIFAHTLGNIPDMDAIVAFCQRHDLLLIEDCCDALGGTFKGQPIGSFGCMATLSMYPSHHITMGEGGFVACDKQYHETLVSLRDWGRACHCNGDSTMLENGACGARFGKWLVGLDEVIDHRYIYSTIGYNLKPMEMQAAMGLVQAKKIPEIVEKRKANFHDYASFFTMYENHFILPAPNPKADPSWFCFPLTVKDNAPFKRADIVRWLESHGVQTRPLFAGNILRHPAYRDVKYIVASDLKNSNKIITDTFFIGVHPGLTEEMRERVKSIFAEFFYGY